MRFAAYFLWWVIVLGVLDCEILKENHVNSSLDGRSAVRGSARYKIGKVAALVGMTAESIRYYEGMGIIFPERDQITGYRYYSAWDISMLVRARTYRQEGFTLEEVVEMMREFNPSNVMSQLKAKENEIRHQIERMADLMFQVKDDQRIVGDAEAGCADFRFEYRPAMHFLQTQVGYDLIPSRIGILANWVKNNAAFILPGGVFRGEAVDDVAYGYFVDDSKLDMVGFRNEDEVEALPSCLCLAWSFYSGSDVELKYESFRPALDYIENEGIVMDGPPVSRIVYMARTGGMEYKSLHKLWIPVKDNGALRIDRTDRIGEILNGISSMRAQESH